MDNIIKPKHGGARPGAGRHTADGARGVSNYQIMLLPRHVTQAKILGDGNISLGIRRAIDAYFDIGESRNMTQAPNTPPEDSKSEPIASDSNTSPGLEKLAPEVKTPE